MSSLSLSTVAHREKREILICYSSSGILVLVEFLESIGATVKYKSYSRVIFAIAVSFMDHARYYRGQCLTAELQGV
jgi:hypothetical protein